MSQAENGNTTSLSRRAALAGLAGAAAAGGVAVPAVAVARGGAHPDGGLLALMPQFEPLFAEWHRQRAIEWGQYCEIESRTKAALGAAASKPKLFDRDHPYWRTRDQIIKATEYDEDDDKDASFYDRLSDFAEEALSWRAETLEGLGFQVRAMMCAYPEIWEPVFNHDDEPRDELFARLIEDICRLCGIPFPPFERMPAAVTFPVDETPPPAAAAPDFTDPIFAAIDEHKRLKREVYRASQALQDAEGDAYEQHGHRPIALITWRNYHIGGEEIEVRRDALLKKPDADPEQIEREYLDAKARYQAKLEAETQWDRRSGTAPLRRKSDEADAEWGRPARSLVR
jgi:hypothetical protein